MSCSVSPTHTSMATNLSNHRSSKRHPRSNMVLHALLAMVLGPHKFHHKWRCRTPYESWSVAQIHTLMATRLSSWYTPMGRPYRHNLHSLCAIERDELGLVHSLVAVL